MGHPGNWTPRKREQVRRENAEADRGRLREVVLYQHTVAALNGQVGPDFFRMHPCTTFRVFRFEAVATCMGCLRQHQVTPYDLNDTPWAHRYWPTVMQELVCPDCGSCPKEVRFKSGTSDVGAISIDAEIVLHIADTNRISRPSPSRGAIDPFSQHDDGDGRSGG